MVNVIVEVTGTGAGSWVEVPGVPVGCLSIVIQARTSSEIQYRYNGQTTYWTVKAGTSKTLIGKFGQGDLLISATAGVAVEVEMSTHGYGL